MNSDVATLQNIANTLEQDPLASQRSQKFAKRTFELANIYKETLCNYISDAKKQGKNTMCLYGQSYIRFLLIYCCQILNVTFVEKDTTDPIAEEAFCVVGELNEETVIKELEEKGCLNLLNIINAEKMI